MDYKQLLKITDDNTGNKIQGFLTVAGLFFEESDKNIIWSKVRQEFKKDFNKQLPFPIYKDRALYAEIKKWISLKTAAKYQRYDYNNTRTNSTSKR